MYPGFGPQKIEMNKKTRSAVPSGEYEAMKKSMLDQNAQSVVNNIRYEGAGSALEMSRSPKYGNVNQMGMTQGMMQGTESAAVQDSFANAPLSKPTAQTGQLGFFSSTQQPQVQPELMGQAAEEGIRQRVLGEQTGLNDRAQMYRMGG